METRSRRRILINCLFIDFALIISAVFFVVSSGLPVPLRLGCPALRFLHIYCPGCGGTRAIKALMHLDIIGSLIYNPFVVIVGLWLLYYNITSFLSLRRSVPPLRESPVLMKWESRASVIFAISLLIFFIIRNLLLIIWHIDPPGDLLQYYL